MIYKALKHVLLGFGLLASLSAGAQDFDSELQLSDDTGIVYWYRICSAVPGMEGYAMTDYNGMTDTEEEFSTVFLLATETEEYHSQWMLTAGENGKIIITNRATGAQISNHSDGADNHNYITLSNDAPGFTFTSPGECGGRWREPLPCNGR